MDSIQKKRQIITTVGWSLLLIWWGVSIAIGPITLALSAIGTGLIFLGVAVACALLRVRVQGSTVVLGIVILVWGALDVTFNLGFWASFAVVLIILGLTQIVSLIPRLRIS